MEKEVLLKQRERAKDERARRELILQEETRLKVIRRIQSGALISVCAAGRGGQIASGERSRACANGKGLRLASVKDVHGGLDHLDRIL